jgi:hypothetical protein
MNQDKLAAQRWAEAYDMGQESVLERVDTIVARMRVTNPADMKAFDEIFDELDGLRDAVAPKRLPAEIPMCDQGWYHCAATGDHSHAAGPLR